MERLFQSSETSVEHNRLLVFRLSSSDLDSASAGSGSGSAGGYQPVLSREGSGGAGSGRSAGATLPPHGAKGMSTGHKAKIRKALMKFNIMPSRNVNRYLNPFAAQS